MDHICAACGQVNISRDGKSFLTPGTSVSFIVPNAPAPLLADRSVCVHRLLVHLSHMIAVMLFLRDF